LDAVFSALVTKLPELGLSGLALWLLFAAWRNATSDRSDYRDSLKAAEERHAAELARVNREHDAEIAEMQQTKARLRKQVEELNAAVDLEREARRAAEEKAFRARRSGGAP
jgi:C4-dicarboxylate-specific signal transduction histidine kinase